MTNKTDKEGGPISKKKLLSYFALAYLGAAALLVAAVLPAEYGIDPLGCLLYTSPSPRDRTRSRMPSSA